MGSPKAIARGVQSVNSKMKNINPNAKNVNLAESPTLAKRLAKNLNTPSWTIAN
jgi:hypothetical protein